MSEKFDALLYERYPLIFANRHAPVSETSMHGAIDCGVGWFDLIEALCERLQFGIDHNGHPQVVAVQVKQKMGGLRFYISGGDDEQRAMVDLAEAMSMRIC